MKKIAVLVIVLSLFFTQIVQAAPSKALSDIKGTWAETYIQKLFLKGIIAGTEKGEYQPNKSITKSEFTTLLVKAMGLTLVEKNSFNDINYYKYWAKPYIEAAVANEIILVNEVGSEFFGDVPLKRTDMAMMMARALKLDPSVSQDNPFYDISEPNGYLTKLYESYLLRGIAEGGKLLFKGNSLSTKAECAAVISRILDYKANPATFITAAAADERIKLGTQTAADIALKRQIEIDKQKSDPNYFIEPVFDIKYNPGIGGYATVKISNIDDLPVDALFKCESISHTALNIFGSNDMYFKYGETRQDNYIKFDSAKFQLFNVLTYNGKNVNGTAEYYYYNFPIGTKIMLKATIKRGLTEKSYDIPVIIQ